MAVPLRLAPSPGHNYADDAALSTGSFISSLPISNLKDDDIQKIWRSANTNLQQLLVLADLGQTRSIGGVALINCNVLCPATFHVRVSTADPTGTDGDAYNVSDITGITDAAYSNFVHFIEPAVSGRYVRINGNGLSVAPEAGRLVIAQTWAPSMDMSFGYERLWRDHSVRTRSLGGNEFVDVKDRQRGYRFTVRGLTLSEAEDQAEELNRLRGIGRDILVCRDVNSSNLGRDTIWGLLEEPARLRQWSDDKDLYEVELEVWNRN
jgi:hypothetical protein